MDNKHPDNTGFKSDHSAILVNLCPFGLIRGRGAWKLNTRILSEKEFIEKLNKEVDHTLKLTALLSPQEKWETLKLIIIAQSQAYSVERASNLKLIVSQLEQKIQELQEKSDGESEAETLLQKTKMDYEEILEDAAKAAAFRSGCTWYNDSEKSSKYFFNLERSKASAKGMSCLIILFKIVYCR